MRGIAIISRKNKKNKEGQRENMQPSCIFKTFALIIQFCLLQVTTSVSFEIIKKYPLQKYGLLSPPPLPK